MYIYIYIYYPTILNYVDVTGSMMSQFCFYFFPSKLIDHPDDIKFGLIDMTNA